MDEIPRPQPPRRRLLKAVVLIASLLACLAVFEILLHVFAPRPLDTPLADQLANAIRDQERMEQRAMVTKMIDPLFHHANFPKQSWAGELEGHAYRITTNAQGDRSAEDFVTGPHPDTYRVGFMGDSFTLGLYVDDTETYPFQLEAMLGAAPGAKKWQCWNFASISYSPMLYWQQYRHTIRNYQPDLLVIAIDNSDLQDDYYYEQDAIFDDQGELRGFHDVHYSFFLGQVRDIGTARERAEALQRRMSSTRERLSGWLTSSFQAAVLVRDLTRRNNIEPGNIASDRFGHCRPGVDWTEHWQRSTRYLTKTVRLAKADGVKVLILFYPYPHQVNGTDWPNGRVSFGFKMGKVYDTPMRGWLRDFARAEQVDFLDAFDAFRQSGIQNFSFKNDAHYLPSGHELLARTLCDHLVTRYNQPAAPAEQRPPRQNR